MHLLKSLALGAALVSLLGLFSQHAAAQTTFEHIAPLSLQKDYRGAALQPTIEPELQVKNASAVPAASPVDRVFKTQVGIAQDPLYACACGCGVFDVATSSMLPTGQGGMAWFGWDYQDQNRNRHGAKPSPSSANDDKDIRTDFFTAGLQYFFDRKWGMQVEVPFDRRHADAAGQVSDWTALGDMRVRGIYTGFFADQSVGIDFGLKLPTGDYTHRDLDRDTQIGSGSTDILLGGFYRTSFTADNTWNFFAQIEADQPIVIQDHYRPGFEVDGALGVYYSGFSLHGVRISPVGQIIGSYRGSDGGDNSAHPVASGYQRVLLSPGLELDFHPFAVYGDVEIPVYQYFRGEQLAAPMLFKVLVSYSF